MTETAGARISDFDLAALYSALDAEREARSLSWSGLTRDRILRFDTPAIYRALDAARTERQLSWKQVAEQNGMANAAQLTRFAKGGGVGIRAIARIAQLLGRPVASFTTASRV